MVRLTVPQFAVLQAMSETIFVERLAGHLRGLGQEPGAAREVADRAYAAGKQRGLRSVEEFDAFAEVLMKAYPGPEPAWSREIIDDSRPMKASRLRTCLGATRRANPYG